MSPVSSGEERTSRHRNALRPLAGRSFGDMRRRLGLISHGMDPRVRMGLQISSSTILPDSPASTRPASPNAFRQISQRGDRSYLELHRGRNWQCL